MPDRITERELERIYDDTIVELYGYVSRRCGGRRELAEDITQETWLRALRHWRVHGVPGKPLGWLTTVARNLVVSYFRRRQTTSLDGVSPEEVLAAVAPWTLANAIQVKFNPQKIGLPKRATVSLTVLNPLGIADLALHGSSAVRGWGQLIPPDENLLFVRGFDASNHRFLYDVNQRFGSTRPRESTARTLPFLSLAVSVDIGVPRERQLLTQRLDAGRGSPGDRANAESMKNLGTSSIPNPMAMVLTQQAELRLTRVQADSLATLSRKFSVFADSVWTPVAAYLVGLPAAYSHGEAYARYVSARERTVDYLLTLVPLVDDVLTPSQRRRLPSQISNYLDRRVLEFLRSSTAGDASTVSR